ncbi:MAG: hypothetical protein WC455_03140 [Dehalococcoidia bacterium]
MADPKNINVIPTKCGRCSSEQVERQEMTMYGKLGFMGPDYRFDCYICRECGFSEFFFQKAKWIK